MSVLSTSPLTFFRRIAVASCAAAIVLSVSSAWTQGRGEAVGGGATADSACLSGMKWTAGEMESPEMHPGWNCIDCHAKGEGPTFLVAGTVYRQIGEPDDCYGVQGAVVQLTDAKGKITAMTSNKAGNFNVRARNATISFPFTAVVVFNGKKNAMATPQSTGNCAGCHTQKGAGGAPGRIVIPSG